MMNAVSSRQVVSRLLYVNGCHSMQVRYIKREPSFSVEKYQDSIGTSVEHEKVTRGTVTRVARYLPVIFLLLRLCCNILTSPFFGLQSV